MNRMNGEIYHSTSPRITSITHLQAGEESLQAGSAPDLQRQREQRILHRMRPRMQRISEFKIGCGEAAEGH